MLEPFLCGCISAAPLLPKLRGHFAEFLNNASPAGLRILSSSTCVGLRYGLASHDSGFSRQSLLRLRYFSSLPITSSPCGTVFPAPRLSPLGPVSALPGPDTFLCPHSSDNTRCWNLNQLSIAYDFRPELRSRLTQSRSALLWNPWIFGHDDSHIILATHSGILSSEHSTAPYRYSFGAAGLLLYHSIK